MDLWLKVTLEFVAAASKDWARVCGGVCEGRCQWRWPPLAMNRAHRRGMERALAAQIFRQALNGTSF